MMASQTLFEKEIEESANRRELEELQKENKRLKEENLELRHLLDDNMLRRKLKKYYKTSYNE